MADTGNINNIAIRQAQPNLVRLIRARQNTYRAAKLTQGLFVFATIALPLLGVAASAGLPTLKPWLAAASLVLLLLDVGWLDGVQKDRNKRGAKLAEKFDTEVLQLPWNRFVAGGEVSPELVHRASKPLSPAREEQIKAWYEKAVSDVPIQLGRLICQRTNIVYDASLRQRYGDWLLATTLCIGLVLLVIALVIDPALSAVLLSFGVPFTPAMAWALRERRKQMDAAASLDTLQAESEKLLDRAFDGASAADLDRASRELQDAIYRHRASSPLIFDWVYSRMRDQNEGEAQHAAEQLVAKAKAALAAQEAVA